MNYRWGIFDTKLDQFIESYPSKTTKKYAQSKLDYMLKTRKNAELSIDTLELRKSFYTVK